MNRRRSLQSVKFDVGIFVLIASALLVGLTT